MLLTFFSLDIRSLKQACERNPCSNNPSISLSALSLPTHVVMRGLPAATPAFAIRLYVEKMGADVTTVNMLPSNKALVGFASHSSKYEGYDDDISGLRVYIYVYMYM